jgi:hypothetical protein
MATGLNPSIPRVLHRASQPAFKLRLACVSLLLLVAHTVQADAMLTDPTKPPIEISNAAVSGVSSGSSAVAAPSVLTPSSLQSVIIAEHRRAAVINGATVELGETVGNETLIEVHADRVTLRSAQGSTQELALYPGVQINKIKVPAPNNTETIARPAKNAPIPKTSKRRQAKPASSAKQPIERE